MVLGHRLPVHYMLVWFQVRSKLAEKLLYACNGISPQLPERRRGAHQRALESGVACMQRLSGGRVLWKAPLFCSLAHDCLRGV